MDSFHRRTGRQALEEVFSESEEWRVESGEWRCKFVSARLNDTNGELGLEEARLFFFMGILGMADLKQSSFLGK